MPLSQYVCLVQMTSFILHLLTFILDIVGPAYEFLSVAPGGRWKQLLNVAIERMCQDLLGSYSIAWIAFNHPSQ